MRVIDISDIANGNMTELGYFDTHPSSQSVSYSGAWNVYPFFESGNIIVSNIDGGFFILRDSQLAAGTVDSAEFAVYPNPADEVLNIRSEATAIESLEVSNTLGQLVISQEVNNSTNEQVDISGLTSGIYFLKINHNTVKRFVVN